MTEPIEDVDRITDRVIDVLVTSGVQANAELVNALVSALLDTPVSNDFLLGVKAEALHQRKRWGTEHDAGKEPQDWYWLLGYLSGKALAAAVKGDKDKGLHHTISSGAVLLNWHAHVTGESTSMRPGIEPPASVGEPLRCAAKTNGLRCEKPWEHGGSHRAAMMDDQAWTWPVEASHPNGRCECAAEGACDWCIEIAKVEGASG